MKAKAFIFISFIALLGCKKNNNLNLVLNGPITDCPANSTCTYSYYDDANFVNWVTPVSGNNRVFWYKSVNSSICDATTQVYFKTSLSNDDFEITSSQIAAGQLAGYSQNCICCNELPTKPIGGDIKGKKTDANHWLINASIILGNSDNHPVDTVVINQTFTLEKLP